MRRAEFAGAVMLLTRLPAGWIAGGAAPADPAQSVWAYPIVGAAVGGIGGLVYWAAARIGLPPLVGAAWTLAAVILTTGALHEDGLADTADGFGAGGDRERTLDIMRDSRIGAFGAIAIALALAARGGAIADIAAPGRVAAALVAAGALSRGAMLIPLLTLPPARADGLGHGLRTRKAGRVAAGLAAAAGIAVMAAPFWSAVSAGGAAVVAALAVKAAARRRIGGYTGDVLGAAAVLAECAALSLLAARGGG